METGKMLREDSAGMKHIGHGPGKCSLCGLPCGRSRLRLELNDDLLNFCCHGCLHVFQILSTGSPDAEADFRSADLFRTCVDAGLIPAAAKTDRPGYRKATGQRDETAIESEDIQNLETIFTVKDLWCGSCAWLIEEILQRTAGISSAQVSFMTNTLKVKYQPHRITSREIAEAVERFGFHVVPVDEQPDANQLRSFLRLGIGAILTFNIMMISFAIYGGFFQDLGQVGISTLSLPLCLLAAPVVFYSGGPILLRAWYGLKSYRFSMDTLIALGALTAFGYSVYQMLHGSIHLYFDTAAMLITMVLLGKFVENRARRRACAGISALQDLAGCKVRRNLNGREQWTETTAMRSGDPFIVRSGERVPADGVVVTGLADVDESVLTGESRPVSKGPEDDVLAGSLLVNGNLHLAATRIGPRSSLGQMIGLVQNALDAQNPAEQLADRITGLFVPLVFLTAAVTAAILIHSGAAADIVVLRAVTILVIACPCALGIATPLAKAAVIAKGRHRGIVIRDAAAFGQAHRIDALVFDKTGTVTEGHFTLRSLYAPGVSETEALQRMAAVEHGEDHFLAREIRRYAAAKGLDADPAADRRSFPGLGVQGRINGEAVVVGSSRFMQELNIAMEPLMALQAAAAEKKGQTVIFAAWQDRVRAMVAFGDIIKAGAPELIAALQRRNIRVWLVSGDSQETTAAIAAQLQIDHFTGKAGPLDKVALVRDLLSQGYRVGMVGDGVNDSAALAQADLGLGVGSNPGNIMEEAADVTLLGRGLDRLEETFELSRTLTRAVRQNLILAFLYNGIGIPFAVAGLLNPLLAVMAMLASSLTVIGNTIRVAGTKPPETATEYKTESSAVLPVSAIPWSQPGYGRQIQEQ